MTNTITIGVTSQIKINGADNWFKLEVSRDVTDTDEETHRDLLDFVEKKFTRTVYHLADTIEGMTNA